VLRCGELTLTSQKRRWAVGHVAQLSRYTHRHFLCSNDALLIVLQSAADLPSGDVD
jgi:hypothetical protein